MERFTSSEVKDFAAVYWKQKAFWSLISSALNTNTRVEPALGHKSVDEAKNVFRSSFATIYSGFSSISIARIHELLLARRSTILSCLLFFIVVVLLLRRNYPFNKNFSLLDCCVCFNVFHGRGWMWGEWKSEKGNQLNEYYFILSERVKKKASLGRLQLKAHVIASSFIHEWIPRFSCSAHPTARVCS